MNSSGIVKLTTSFNRAGPTFAAVRAPRGRRHWVARLATRSPQGLEQILRQQCHALGHSSRVAHKLLGGAGHERSPGTGSLGEKFPELGKRLACHLRADVLSQEPTDRLDEYLRLDGTQQTVDLLTAPVRAS